jgi:hypothetical protein
MKTNQLLKSSLALLTIAILATVTAFTVRQGEVAKTAHLTAPKDILQFTSGGHVLGFAKTGVYMASGSHALRVEFVNSHSISPISPAAPNAPDNANDAKKATPLSNVTYPHLWDGVTLTYDAPGGAVVRSTYRLEPYANAENIRLRYNAPVSVQNDGSLRIGFQTGTLNESAPQAWQERSGKRVPVQIAFAARGKDEITFTTGHYDRSQPLFIDPTLTWNTFLGGSGDDFGYALAVDGTGNIYVAGYSSATWGSPVRAYSDSGNNNFFAAKLDSTGNLIWNTFLGSSDGEGFGGVAVDGSGNVYVAGFSQVTWGSPVRAFSGCNNVTADPFAAKLDSNGNLIWNTFLGGCGGGQFGFAVAVDGSGNVYVAGRGVGASGAFAAKLDSNGNLIWNTFLGSGDGGGFAVAVDGSGNVYVAGQSFAAKLDATGNLTWNTFLGGTGYGIAVDMSGNVYVAGTSGATWGSPVRAFSGVEDAFAAKLDANGNLTWNTFLGGSGFDAGRALALDVSGNVYVAGYSSATWGSPDRAYSGGYNAFAAKLDSNGNLTWNTFLGGSGFDLGFGLGVDMSGNVYVAGTSGGTWGSPVRAFSGGLDAFVAKLSAPYSAQIQPPINPDGTSVFNVRRGVVPVRFTLTQNGAPTCALPPATIALTRTAGGTTGTVNESDYIMAADNGSNFRIDGCQYVYNLNSSALGVGTYRVDITINGQVVGSAIFQLN